MKTSIQRSLSIFAISLFATFAVVVFSDGIDLSPTAIAQEKTSPTPTPKPVFDQKAAIANLKEQIKGREKEPAGEVFKNVKDFAKVPAGRLLAIMEFGYARSLGVDCTHCHTPEDWGSDSKQAKTTARAMRAMANKINGELLPSIAAFKDRTGRDRAIVNCTTCHRGQVKPATNLGR